MCYFKQLFLNEDLIYKSSMQKEKGVVLYLAVVVTALMLAMVLGLGSIFIGQLKILRGVGHSVTALYAAEAGMEKVLYDPKLGVDIVAVCHTDHPPHVHCPGGPLSNGATYEVTVEPAGGPCGATLYCIESSGTFENSERKISVDR